MQGSGGLLIGYSLGVCMGQADTDRIFIGHMQGSGGLLSQISLGVYAWVRRILIQYSLCDAGVRWILIQYSLRVFIVRQTLIAYSLQLCRGEADMDRIFVGCIMGLADYWLNIHSWGCQADY